MESIDLQREAHSQKGVVAAGHARTAEAAISVLREGGNAFDAAIAALFASWVAEPCMSSPGGGFHAALRQSGGETTILDAFCSTPLRKPDGSDIDFYPVEIDFGDTLESFQVGRASVAVPGAIPGLLALWESHATLPLPVLAAPAVEMAKQGVVMDTFQAYDFKLLTPILRISPQADHYFESDRQFGDALQEGSLLHQPALANFLHELAVRDKTFLPEWKRMICAEVHGDGLLHEDDLDRFKVIWRDALRLSDMNGQLYLNPSPSSGGSVIGLAMSLLKNTDQLGKEAVAARLAPLISRALEMRDRSVSMTALEDAALEELRGEHVYKSNPGLLAPGGTTHFSILDKAGNAVSLSSTNGEGSGVWVKDTGVQLNNMLGEAALFPGGFHSWEPASRVSSLMAPTIHERTDGDLVVLGTGGAGRIPWAIAQVLGALQSPNVDLRHAVEMPRCFNQDGVLQIEPGLETLAQRSGGKLWSRKDMFFGGINVVQGKPGKSLLAIADSRRLGTAMGV